MSRLRFARLTDVREYLAVFWLIGTPKATIGRKTKLLQSVFDAEVIVRSGRTSGLGWECDINGEVVRFASGSCQHCQRSWGECITSSRTSGRCLFIEGAVDGCGEERVACSGNRQRWHNHVRRLVDSAILKRAQARWYKDRIIIIIIIMVIFKCYFSGELKALS